MRRLLGATVLLAALHLQAQQPVPATLDIATGWKLVDASQVKATGAEISRTSFLVTGWHPAIVPGTVLTSLVQDGLYPEPFYGENNRHIPESLARTTWWYRTTVTIPVSYAHRHIWLHCEGINYAASIWVNGAEAGSMRGAFIRGRFDITRLVKLGTRAVIAIEVAPQPHPGTPHEHTLAAGMGRNGGQTAIDGPTFLATIGWDWLPAIRDRDTGIWQRVYLSTSDDVLLDDPQVTTALPLPQTNTADLTVKATLENTSDQSRHGTLRGQIGDITFAREVDLPAAQTTTITFNPTTNAALHLDTPRLWWPNGYGPQNLYQLKLTFIEDNHRISDASETTFGIRQITYGSATDPLTISVNGVKIFIRGGDWGLDEGMKRESPARMDAQMRLHALANLNLIRNWVGQSTSELFYQMADKYGLLIWDEFFQPNPSDGPNPEDLDTYLANVRDKVLRFRNHPSIALWCGRNEGPPPPDLDDALRTMMATLDPVRLYQSSSTDGRGVRSGGPYLWRAPRDFYTWKEGEVFKTEIGSVSIPTLESIQGMMPAKDWQTVNDDWAEHDFAKGMSGSDTYKATMEARYGTVRNLADFARKGQMMNYEAFRSMYEGRNARMFSTKDPSATAIITWMSNPAQPSFVWQLYHYDLEPNAALFAVKSAAEHIHVQSNEVTGAIEVINNSPEAFTGTVVARIFSLDGKLLNEQIVPVDVAGSWESDFTKLDVDTTAVHFIELQLKDATGAVISRNVYWRGAGEHNDDLTAMDTMPLAKLTASVARQDRAGATAINIMLHNPTPHIAVMAHFQLRRADGERILPAYPSANYITLMPGEETAFTIEAATSALHGQPAMVIVDGWNISIASAQSSGVLLREQVADPVVTHLPIKNRPAAQ